MGSFRFLLSRRWAFFALAVVFLVVATIWLGKWQFNRLHETRDDNGIIEANEHADPAPVGSVLDVGRSVGEKDEWRRVTATGHYDVKNSIIWRYRSDDHDTNGIDVVVPLVTGNGTRLLVDRGWMQVADQTEYPKLPAPPSGQVTVTGWVRSDGTGDATEVDKTEGHWGTRALSSATVSRALGVSTYGGFVMVDKEDPAPASSLTHTELPDLGDGPHFFYGIQWWFFGAMAIFGFFYLLYDERRAQMRQEDPEAPDPGAERKARRAAKNAHKQAVRAAYQAAYAQENAQEKGQSERVEPPSTETIDPETYEAAGESTNAATRPNSSGRP